MNFLLLSCKKATFLIEKRELSSLSFIERIQLKLHTSMCEACRIYEKQSKIIDEALSQWIKAAAEKKEFLSKEVKEKIISELKKF
jgi:hypothetical protein